MKSTRAPKCEPRLNSAPNRLIPGRKKSRKSTKARLRRSSRLTSKLGATVDTDGVDGDPASFIRGHARAAPKKVAS
jgi:hypothetical protein